LREWANRDTTRRMERAMAENSWTWETDLPAAQQRAERERRVVLADFSREH